MFAINTNHKPISPICADAYAALTAMISEDNTKIDKQILMIQKDLKVSRDVAYDVFYLRGRPCHTPALEKQLLADHAAGKKINIFTWGKNAGC